MKPLRVKSVYSCYPLYQILFGGSPVLKYHEALCVAEVCNLLNFTPKTVTELFCGMQEHRRALEHTVLGTYAGVDLLRFGDNIVCDLSKGFANVLPKTDLLVAGLRSVETTVCDSDGHITWGVLERFLSSCRTALNPNGLLYLDINGSYQDVSCTDTIANCSLSQVDALCKVFGLASPLSRRSSLVYSAETDFNPVNNNLVCRYSGTLHTDCESRDFEVVNPFTFRFWQPHELVHIAKTCGLKLVGIYSAPENLLSSGLLYKPIEYGAANKLVFALDSSAYDVIK